MKTCTSCLLELELDNFSKSAKNKDGLRYSCKKCEKIKASKHYEKNAAKIKRKVANWQDLNKPKVQEYKAQFQRRKDEKVAAAIAAPEQAVIQPEIIQVETVLTEPSVDNTETNVQKT